MDNPIICALDTTDIEKARQMTASLKGSVGVIKLGLEFFTANGAAGVAQVSALGMPIFLDLKFHDIPNTVAGAVRAAANVDCFMMTVHTAGGAAMMKAAADAASENAAKTGKPRPLVVGVTLLTSMDQNDLDQVGYALNLADQVVKMASLAQSAGLDGVVCSPREISALRRVCGKDFKLVVPGIRPAGSDAGDQKRVMTPKEAIAAGADYLVIGRPISGATDVKAAAETIMEELAGVPLL